LVLLFDLGRVLVDIAIFDALRALLGEALDDDAVRARWLRSPVVRSLELGRITPSVFASRFVEEWQVPLTPGAFLLDFFSWVREPYPGAEELITGLRGGHHVSCLSNCNELHWSKLTSFLSCFDSAFSSHLLGEIKPDEAAFRAVVSALRVEADDVCFFDDSRANVESARRVGIRAFLVHGVDDVRHCLSDEGLL
jgi:HAD superfamily hydrolase (TIGR01509 family)